MFGLAALTSANILEDSIMKCFTPILVFAFLYLAKIFMFKTKNTAI